MTTIASNLQSVHARIARACAAAQRDVNEVTLLPVSKTFGPDAVREAFAAGEAAFGENYIQEAIEKQASLADLPLTWHCIGPIQSNKTRLVAQHFAWAHAVDRLKIALLADLPLEWHCIGPIQSNKTRLVAQHFDWAHTVDRLKVAQRLSEQRPEGRPPLNVCLQVNIDGGAAKSGVVPHEALDLARQVAQLPRLRLRGLMTIPEPVEGFDAQVAVHERAAQLLRDLGEAGLPLDTLSMGMTADLEAAIAAGSTMVRIGTAIFGGRTRKPA